MMQQAVYSLNMINGLIYNMNQETFPCVVEVTDVQSLSSSLPLGIGGSSFYCYVLLVLYCKVHQLELFCLVT